LAYFTRATLPTPFFQAEVAEPIDLNSAPLRVVGANFTAANGCGHPLKRTRCVIRLAACNQRSGSDRQESLYGDLWGNTVPLAFLQSVRKRLCSKIVLCGYGIWLFATFGSPLGGGR
jgi:hypothetical protein